MPVRASDFWVEAFGLRCFAFAMKVRSNKQEFVFQRNLFRLDFFHAAHVFAEGFGDGDGAVRVLVVFEDGDEDARAGDDGVVEGVAEERFAVGGFVAEVAAAGLEIVEAAGGVGFAVAVAGGHPGFHVDHAGVFDAQVAGAALQQAVGEVQALEHFFGEGEHLAVPRFAFFLVVFADDDLFDLVELVDAVEAGGVLAVGAGLAAEAGGDGDVCFGEVRFVRGFRPCGRR